MEMRFVSVTRPCMPRYPLCLSMPDPAWKRAFHVACDYSASPVVMEFLVGKNAHAAGVQDPEGKALIHYVGESLRELRLFIPP
jgi:hypothetical protein